VIERFNDDEWFTALGETRASPTTSQHRNAPAQTNANEIGSRPDWTIVAGVVADAHRFVTSAAQPKARRTARGRA
jgi:hypothetical protein